MTDDTAREPSSDPLSIVFDFFNTIQTDSGFFRRSTKKPRGRPKGSLGQKARAIREAVLDLTQEYPVMSVRQVFYQLETRGIVPKDENAGYRPVQEQVLKMRREGVLPWRFISDATRWMRKPDSFMSVDEAIASMHRTYRRDLWQGQNVRIEIWLEKDALAGVVSEITNRWDVPLMVSRGTSSATFLHSAGQAAFEAWAQHPEIVTFIYALYDYDAAGRRAARNIEKGLHDHAGGAPISFELLAVTDDQIDDWDLPTRPAKASDPEAHKFGDQAVELDAIPPNKLLDLVETAITSHIDKTAWEQERISEDSERAFLEQLSEGAS